MDNQIPLYSSDGELLDWIGQKRVDRLIAADMVAVVHTRKGKIRRLNLRQRPDGPTPNCIADYIGTRYSFRERLDNGRIVWSLKKLGEGDKLRPIFRQVVNDCLAIP
jgi:hypothetical protein